MFLEGYKVQLNINYPGIQIHDVRRKDDLSREYPVKEPRER
jgi:hypothetical protein